MKLFSRIKLIFLFVLCGQFVYASAPPTIISQSPAPNAVGVSQADYPTVSFDVDMDGLTINESTFLVYGSLSGPVAGTVDYQGGTRTATFSSPTLFSPGETVTVTITDGMQAGNGEPLAEPYVWLFIVETTGGTGHFEYGPQIPLEGLPVAVAIGYFNGDTFPDVAAVNYTLNSVTVSFNNGDGSFVIDSTYDVGTTPPHICTGDFNLDGAMDIATPNFDDNDVTVLLNDGHGTFVQQTPVPAGNGPRSILSADLDGDGDIDLATANQNSGDISILINDGTGAMVLDSSYLIGATIFYVHASDLDRDGRLDLVVASSSVDSMYTLMNIGQGVFAPAARYSISGSHPRGATAADFDGDGNADIATANDHSSDVSIFINQGDGTFGSDVIYNTLVGSFTIDHADLDADDDLDLITADGGNFGTSILLNDGSGNFAFDRFYRTDLNGCYGNALCDLDGDGDLDIAAAGFGPPAVTILLNKNKSAIASVYPAPNATSVPVTDEIAINLTGDLAPATLTDTTVLVHSRARGLLSGTLSYAGMMITFSPDQPFLPGEEITTTLTNGLTVTHPLFGDVDPMYTWSFTAAVRGGVGYFQDAITIPLNPDDQPRALKTADLDGDGLLDIAVCNGTSNNIMVLINNGDSTFSSQIAGAVDRIPYDIDAADLDNDGDPDLITASLGDSSISICYNDGSGMCESIVNIIEGVKTSAVTAADFDNDGHIDLAAAKVYSDSVYIYFNDGQGGFSVPGNPYYVQGAPYTIISTDIDSDGDIDLIAAMYSDTNFVTILYNNSRGVFTHSEFKELYVRDSAATYDSAHTVYANDFNGDGMNDMVVGHVWADDLTLSLNDGTGSFLSPVNYDVTSRPHDVVGADFDADGDIDLAGADQTIPGSVTILENDGSALFDFTGVYMVGDSTHGVVAADIDNDGDIDLVTVNGLSNDVSILLNKDSVHVASGNNVSSVIQGDSCLLEVWVTGDPDGVILHYRLGGETAWTDTVLASPDSLYDCLIATDPLGLRTTEYYFEAVQGDRSLTLPETAPVLHPEYIRSEITTATATNVRERVYQMIGFPFEVNPGHPETVFADDLGAYNNERWRLGRWDPTLLPEPGYVEYPDLDTVQRGDGFWLHTRVGVHVDASGLSSIPDTTVGDATYWRWDLSPGWNQIATPFAFPVSWSHRIASTDVEAAVYTYSVTEIDASYAVVDTLMPFHGYFVMNNADVRETILLPYVRASLLPPSPAAPSTPSHDFWQVQLSLESEGIADICNIIGVRSDAVEGKDRHDLSEPPPPPGRFVSLSFEQFNLGDGKLLSGDFREPGNGWVFTVFICGNADAPARLRLKDTLLLPQEFNVILEDIASGERYPVSANESLTLPYRLSVEGRRYRLLVGSENFIENYEGGPAAVPDRFELYQNEPNPFNPETAIRYDLPVPGHVRLEIFNILGQKVVTLVDRHMDAGAHRVIWNGTDRDGNTVASGIYLYRLSAGTETARRKMMLLK